jgi:hypothetical protein
MVNSTDAKNEIVAGIIEFKSVQAVLVPVENFYFSNFLAFFAHHELFHWPVRQSHTPLFRTLAIVQHKVELGAIAIFNCILKAYKRPVLNPQSRILFSLSWTRNFYFLSLAITLADYFCEPNVLNQQMQVARSDISSLRIFNFAPYSLAV